MPNLTELFVIHGFGPSLLLIPQRERFEKGFPNPARIGMKGDPLGLCHTEPPGDRTERQAAP